MKTLYISDKILVICEKDVKEPDNWVENRVLAEDRERYLRFVTNDSRRRFLLSRELVYKAFDQIGIKGVSLSSSCSNRRPLVLYTEKLWASISHTPGIIVVAVSSSGPIGIDVEVQERDIETLGFLGMCCSELEINTLNTLSDKDRRYELLDLWIAKEALSKVVGLGLAADFRELTRERHCLNKLGIQELVYSDYDIYRLCWTIPKGE